MNNLLFFYRAVIIRETLKMLKQRDRLAAAMIRPLLWLWIIGGGMQALAGHDYTTRLLPGIVGMTLLFGGMVGGLSIAFDKDAGTMRLLVTSPVKSQHVLIAKALAASVAALLQVALLMAVLIFLESLAAGLNILGFDLSRVFPWVSHYTLPNIPMLLLALIIGAFSCGTLGVLCGVFAKSIDGFAVVMNFVIFPLFFFSGALYPLDPMPVVAKSIALINPFTYSVDLLRHAFVSHAELTISTSIGFSITSSVLMLALGTWKFSQSGAAIPIHTSNKY